MARKLRLQYPGAIYHVMSRGDRREAIFTDDRDRQIFLDTLGEACQKTAWQVHAWCQVRNHFHLVVETPQANLVAGMRWFLGVYTSRFNHRQREFGHLFSGRYKALLVDGSGNGYLKAVCDYVHLNPVRAKLLAAEAALRAYRWSSFPFYLKEPPGRPPWLRVDRVLGEWGIPKDSAAGRRELELRLEARRLAEARAGLRSVQGRVVCRPRGVPGGTAGPSQRSGAPRASGTRGSGERGGQGRRPAAGGTPTFGLVGGSLGGAAQG